ncbi:MAG: M1 family aminopeptidase [Terriglobales bacterium]
MSSSILGFILWSSLGSVLAQSGFWAPVIPPHAQYQIQCSFDTVTVQLRGNETIRFRNTTRRAMDRLALAWSLGPNKTVSATANGKAVLFLVPPGEKESNGPLLLQLPEALKPGAELELKVEFRNSYEGDFDSKRGLLWQSWYPQLWWGFGTPDDYEVQIAVPSGWGVVTSGVLDPGAGIWKAKDVRDFAAWIFDEKQYVVDRAEADDVLVTAVHTAAGTKCAQLVLQTAVDVIGFYRERFGFYPHRSLTIIPGMDYPAGGYPVATAMVAIHGEEQMEKKPEAHFRWITAHEIGHMYWSQYVLAEGEDDLNWLMIGLGIFADREYRRARGIEPPVGNLPAGYVGSRKDGVDTTMDLSDEQEELIEWDFNNIVEHGKSSAMMDALESTIGAEVFDHAYRRSLREFHGRRMNWHDFEKVCEEESGEDLGWFFESWVRTNEFAFYRIARQESTRTGSGWRTGVEVESRGTRLARVPVVATFMDNSQQTQHTDRLAALSVLVFESKSPLKDVKLDPTNSLWMLASEPALSATDLERRVLRMKLTDSGEEALQLMPRARELHLTHSQAWRHLGLMLYDARHYPESLECFQKAFETTTDKDYQFMALAWQGLLLDLMGRREAAIEAYKAAQANGSEQLFRHDQYKLSIDQKWIEERLRTPFKRE